MKYFIQKINKKCICLINNFLEKKMNIGIAAIFYWFVDQQNV